MKKGLFLASILLIMLVSCKSAPLPAPKPTPFTGEGRVQLDDITMYFEVHGDGEPLIFLHGGLESADAWSNQVPIFSQQYRVVTPDSRGQGRTTDSDAPISYKLMGEDTVRLMDYLGIDSAYIVGWSDGAVTGIELAIHHPDRVKALVAYGANMTHDGLTDNLLGWIRDTPGADWVDGLEEDYKNMSPQPDRLPTIMEKIRLMWLTQPDYTAEELASIKVPTLILAGENDEFVRADQPQLLANAIPNAELVIFPDVGHYALTEKPDEWNKVVLDFLKDK